MKYFILVGLQICHRQCFSFRIQHCKETNITDVGNKSEEVLK